jgi:HSP20 family molecular chaperone IbpA
MKERKMAKGEIEVKKPQTLLDELEKLHQAITQRAYDLFRTGSSWGGPLADWLNAERELIAKPAVELRQRDGQFEVSAALPGIDAKDIDLQITPEELLIKAETTREKKTDKSTVHMSEFSCGQVFRSVRFPERIDPETAKAEYKNGMLQLTATIAKSAAAKKVDVKAA